MRAITWFIPALLVSNLATAYFVRKTSINPYRDMTNAMLSMARPDGPFVVIIGDSLTNNAHFPSEICGHRTVKMGIDGAKASTFIQYAEQMSSSNLHPSLVSSPLVLTMQSKQVDPISRNHSTYCCETCRNLHWRSRRFFRALFQLTRSTMK